MLNQKKLKLEFFRENRLVFLENTPESIAEAVCLLREKREAKKAPGKTRYERIADETQRLIVEGIKEDIIEN